MLGGMHAKGKGQIGAIVTGRTMARIEGGYIINGVDLPHGKGFVPEENNLAIGSEILVKIVGHYHGMALLHPMFNGFR